jgi:glycerol-3-phosphate acyltransferase PlsY
MERPTEIHVVALKRFMKYLKGSISYDILYKKASSEEMKLYGSTNFDYAGDLRHKTCPRKNKGV